MMKLTNGGTGRWESLKPPFGLQGFNHEIIQYSIALVHVHVHVLIRMGDVSKKAELHWRLQEEVLQSKNENTGLWVLGLIGNDWRETGPNPLVA